MNDRPALEARTELGLQSRSALFSHYMIPSFGRNATPQGLPVPGRPWLMVLALLACSWTAGAREYTETLSARSEGRRIEGSLDWTNGILTVSGEAAAPADLTDPARRRLAGFTAARETAYRNLAVIAGEVPLDADTRMHGATLADNHLAVKFDQLVKAARVDLRSRRERGGLFRLELNLNLRGRFSDAVLPDSTLELLPPGELPAADSLLLFTTQETYTGLVVDARGTGLKPCMAPRIFDASGRVIYSSGHAGRNCSLYEGVAGYENDLQRAAKSSRVGGARARPLIIEADGSSGTFSADATVSRDLGTRVLMAAVESNFLSQCGVVFVLGRKPEPPPVVLVPDTPRLDTEITAATDSVQVDSVVVDSAAPDPYDLQLYRLLGTEPPLPPFADTVGYFDFDELLREAGRVDGE